MMNRIKIALLASLALGCALPAYAQNYSDVLRYSQKYNQGTARSFGTANAMGALGADFSAIDINPAGLGVYRRPEFTFSLDLNRQRASSTYLGSASTDDKYNLSISNIGLVIASVRTEAGKPIQHGWVSVNYGFGFQRTNNFHSNVALEGVNTQNSVLTSYKESANGHTPSLLDPFSTGYLAYQTYLLDPVGSDTSQYMEAFNYEKPGAFKKAYQTDYINTRGATNNINFAVSGNYSNKLYVGANIIVPTVGYHYDRTFTETNASDSVTYYHGASFKENINTSGLGITASLGLIYRITDYWRAGASVQLPSFLSLNDEYSYEMTGYTKANGLVKVPSDIGTYHYTIVTPAKATVSTALLFSKFGFISLDYEYVDYSSGRINTSYEGSRAANKVIESVLHPASNLRIGGEYRTDNVSFRAGYSMFGSPYSGTVAQPKGFDGRARILALGFGIRDENYFFDLGYQNQLDKYFHLPYKLSTQEVEGGNISNYRGSFIATLGCRF